MPSELEDTSINAQLLIKSIGYASTPMQGAPFDHKRKIIPSEHGCVIDPQTKEKQQGLYVCGWVKRGPVGIIDATLRDTKETFGHMRHDIETD